MCRCGFCFKYGEVFIEERNGTWNTPYLFNGKELDEETGLYYYGARYLNPTNGMWLSVDPLFEKYVGMSPYKYCNLNPMRFIDPLGMAEEETDNLKTNVVNLTTVGLAVKEKTIEDSGRRKIEKLEKSTPNRITSGVPGCKPKKAQVKEIKATDAKLAKVKGASNLLTGYCIIEKGRDIYKKGSVDWKDGYDCGSIAVSTMGVRGAIISATVELYRQAGEWFIEKVQDFNSFVERNKVDIMSNMYYTGSPF